MVKDNHVIELLEKREALKKGNGLRIVSRQTPQNGLDIRSSFICILFFFQLKSI